MFARHRVAVVVVVGVALAAACSGGGSDPEPSPYPTTEPALTAPPTLNPEEQAAAEIQATFEDLIAAWDDFKANASDYVDDAAADPAWNFGLVETEMHMLDEAQLDFLNSTNAFLDSAVEQVGRTEVATMEVREVEFGGDDSASATGEACLDLSNLSFTTYDGESADLPAAPSTYQHWTFAVRFIPNRSGWFVTRADVEVMDACP